MTLTPNTQITQENVGLLKAGDVLRRPDGRFCTVHPDHKPDDTLVYFHAFDEEVGGHYQGHAFPEIFTYIGPDLGDGWIGWGGGPNPVGTDIIEVRHRSGIECLCEADTFEALGWEWSDSDPDVTDIIAFRPALSPPAEGEDDDDMSDASLVALILRDTLSIGRGTTDGDPVTFIEGIQEAADYISARVPTPAPVDHIGDVTEKIDWERVGPKLVEALEKIERWFGEFPETGMFWPNTDGSESDRPMPYGAAWGSNGERDFMRSVARAALAAAQPEGK